MCDLSFIDFPINNIHHEKRGFEKFQQLYDQKQFCDMNISGKSKTFQVHTNVMVAFSKYIETEANKINDNSERIKIRLPNIKDEILAKIIDYCYAGVLNVHAANVLDITDASGFLQMDHLLQESEKLSRSYMNVNNCFTLLNIAEKYHLEELKTFVKEYIDFNFIQIYNTAEFLNIEYEKLLELVKSENLNVTKELDVFESVKLWILHDEDNRKEHLIKLIDFIKIPLLEKDEIFDNVDFCENRNCGKRMVDALRIKLTPSSSKPKPRIPGCVILILGDRNENSSSKSMIYDPTKNQWIEYIDLEVNLKNFNAAILKDEIIILGGYLFGRQQIYRSNVFYYDMKKHVKHGLPPMIHKRYRPGLAVIDDVLFVAGGFDGRSVLKQAEMYDTKTRKWKAIESMSSERKDCVGIAFMNEMFVIGGNDGSSSLKTVEAYCPNTNKWRSVESMNEARENASAAVIKNFIYVVGGSQSDKYLKTVEIYNPISNVWTSMSEISTPRHGIGLCAVGSDLYAIGGVNQNGTLSNIEKVDTSNPAGTWSEIVPPQKWGNCTAIAISKPHLKRLIPDVIKD